MSIVSRSHLTCAHLTRGDPLRHTICHSNSDDFCYFEYFVFRRSRWRHWRRKMLQ